MPYLALCVEGTKGAGKTTTIEKLALRLAQEGFEVERCAPFTAANEMARTKGFASAREMIGASKQDNQAEIDFICSMIAEAQQAARQKAQTGTKPVVLLIDRGWMTILPHLLGGRWRAEEGANSEEIHKIWNQVLAEAPATVFLHASFEITRQRRARPDLVGGLDTDEKLYRDVKERRAFAKAYSDKIVLSFDMGVVPQEEVVAALADYVRANITKKFCVEETPAP
jgi:thymidylate kinase